jgi:hypothetical protein
MIKRFYPVVLVKWKDLRAIYITVIYFFQTMYLANYEDLETRVSELKNPFSDPFINTWVCRDIPTQKKFIILLFLYHATPH